MYILSTLNGVHAFFVFQHALADSGWVIGQINVALAPLNRTLALILSTILLFHLFNVANIRICFWLSRFKWNFNKPNITRRWTRLHPPSFVEMFSLVSGLVPALVNMKPGSGCVSRRCFVVLEPWMELSFAGVQPGLQPGPTRGSSDAMLLTAGQQHYFNKPHICLSQLHVCSSVVRVRVKSDWWATETFVGCCIAIVACFHCCQDLLQLA